MGGCGTPYSKTFMRAYGVTLARKRNSDLELNTNGIDERKIASIDSRMARFGLDSKIERITKDKYFQKNWYYPGNKDAFPYHAHLRYVERFYPMAKPCPMAFDEPTTIEDIADCHKKADVLKILGIKYAYVTRTMEESEILDQLGDLNGVANIN